MLRLNWSSHPGAPRNPEHRKRVRRRTRSGRQEPTTAGKGNCEKTCPWLPTKSGPGKWQTHPVRVLSCRFAFARRKFKGDLAGVIHHEIRRKRPAGLGNEFVEQIGLARGQQLLRLRPLNRLLQNFPADFEFARLACPPATFHTGRPRRFQTPCRRIWDICPAVPCR